MSFYSKYRGKNCGRILHFLEHYCGLHVAEHAKFSDNYQLTYFGKLLATYKWSEKTFEGDVPEFEFALTDADGRAHKYRQDNQKQNRDEAINDGILFFPIPDVSERQEVSQDIIRALNSKAEREVYTYAQIFGRGYNAEFFMGRIHIGDNYGKTPVMFARVKPEVDGKTVSRSLVYWNDENQMWFWAK